MSNRNGNGSSAYKSEASRNGVNGTAGHVKNKTVENGTVKQELPRGIQELVKTNFAPGVKGHFEQRTRLPLLRATNLSITWKSRFAGNLVRSSSRKNSPNEDSTRTRCNSAAADVRESNDSLAVRTCWDVILSFMGDENENIENGQSTRLFETTISDRRQHFSSRKKPWRKIIEEKLNGDNKHADTKRPQSLYIDQQINKEPGKTAVLASGVGQRCNELTVLEKVRFLANVGLQHRHLRDEIYCQILKQLVHNPSLRSSALGWILLATIIGCFPPTKQIISYVRHYLDQQETESASYCLEKLNRILVNGERKTAPCSLELQAAKSRLKIRLPIICMDHSVRTIYVDSSSTTEEICSTMAVKNRMGDSSGFSLFLSMDSKLVPLGNRNFYIMDAISQTEYFSKINKVRETWRIYYRREFFSPRDAGGVPKNHMKSWLTYSQICGGVQSGEYQCGKSQDLALLIAHQYCLRHSLDQIDMKRVNTICQHSLPASLLGDDKGKKWSQMVYNTLTALAEKGRPNARVDSLDIMQQVIRYASLAFIENFTKSFGLSTFRQVTDSDKYLTNLIMQLNHEYLTIRLNCAIRRENTNNENKNEVMVTEVDKIQSAIPFNTSKLGDSQFKLTLYDGREYLIGSQQTAEIVATLNQFVAEIGKGQHNESEA